VLQRKRLALGAVGSCVVAVLVAVPLATGGQGRDATDQIRSELKGGPAKNVIFFLGDGMGTQEITAARYYQYGAAGRMNVDRLPFTGFQTTWSLKPGTAPYLPDYDPDSASTGTMWATGQKTIDERISQGPSAALETPGANLKTVLEVAQKQGKRTGNVSTAEITDATPAVLDSHVSQRGCQGPKDMTLCPTETKAAGGLGSIAEQTVDHKVDVVLGGGQGRFNAAGGPIAGGPDNGKTVEQSAARQGYTEVNTAADLDAITPKGLPVLGLFTAGNMTTEWTGPIATRGDGVAPHKCTTTNRPANEPSLSAMTKKAIQLLDAKSWKGKDNGFFLQVEGASIDKQDHAANACGQLGETVAFDDAIGVALDYQRSHPDTLIVVTADHSHTSQIVAEDSTGTGNPTGYSDNLITKDNQVQRITYGTAGGATPPSAPPSQQHTGAVVPIWGKGPGAGAILGTTDHTDLFKVLQGSSGYHW
jgi:alkaline phosphatase